MLLLQLQSRGERGGDMSRHVTAKFDPDADADFADEYNLRQNSGMFNIIMIIFVIKSCNTMMTNCEQVLLWPGLAT